MLRAMLRSLLDRLLQLLWTFQHRPYIRTFALGLPHLFACLAYRLLHRVRAALYGVVQPAGDGGGSHPDTLLMMADGSSRRVADLVPGDQLMSGDGMKTPVAVQTVNRSRSSMWRIQPHPDAIAAGVEPFIITGGHLLVLRIIRRPWKESRGDEHGIVNYQLNPSGEPEVVREPFGRGAAARAARDAALAHRRKAWQALHFNQSVNSCRALSSELRSVCRLTRMIPPFTLAFAIFPHAEPAEEAEEENEQQRAVVDLPAPSPAAWSPPPAHSILEPRLHSCTPTAAVASHGDCVGTAGRTGVALGSRERCVV